VNGSFTANGDELAVTVRLYETRRGRLLSERAFTGVDPLVLADTISRVLRRDLEIPAHHIDETEDLPAADLMTSSPESYRHLVEAYRALTVDEDWAAASAAIEASVAADATNAYAHVVHYVISLLANDQATAARALQGAMQHIYKLPERSQYPVKMAHYEFNREPDKQLAVAEMRVEVFPDDIEGRQILSALYGVRKNYDGIIEQFQAILELDPSQVEYLQQLGQVYAAKGDFETATAYHARYAEQFPDDADAYMALGRLNRVQGEFDEAKAQFERALLIEPNDVAAQLELAGLRRRFGDFAGELAQLEALLPRSVTAQDSVRILSALRGAHAYRGQVVRSIDYLHQSWAVGSSFNPPVAMLLQQLGALDEYVKVGQEERARQTLAAISQQLAPPFDGLIPVGRLSLALEVEDPDEAEAAIAGVQQFIDAFGAATLNALALEGRARVLEMRHQYAEAAEAFARQLADDPTDMSVHIDIGRCQRLAGDLAAAERSLNRGLVAFPNSPTAHYQLALVADQRGDTSAAVEHLQRAAAVWADADATFRPATEVRDKLAALTGG